MWCREKLNRKMMSEKNWQRRPREERERAMEIVELSSSGGSIVPQITPGKEGQKKKQRIQDRENC